MSCDDGRVAKRTGGGNHWKCIELHMDLYLVFVELTKAFDTVYI